jgi:hypothetical protein
MINKAMAKNSKPPSSAPTGARRRGRPAKPGGRIPQVEVQRAYRARLAAAGKVVRVVDAAASTSPTVPISPDYDPAIDGVYERTMFEKMRDDLHNALLRIEILAEDRNRWQTDCARAEAEPRVERQHHTNTIKDKIMIQKEIIALKQMARRPK